MVVDIGGGTSDFSLFDVARRAGLDLPHVTRVAVSDHLLLGGDNIDLALAHRIVQSMPEGTDLAPAQWNSLVAQCRDLKERRLSDASEESETFAVAIPGRGSGLLGCTKTARISRGEIDAILLEGFFPECEADAEPAHTQAALREWALPYATDSAVTRYLADFMRGRPRVDAVLFNGGTLYPETLRTRLKQQIGIWQGGRVPVVLENSEPDLAVARGAARFGSIMHGRAQRIEAGAARSIYIEVQSLSGEEKQSAHRLLCILPRGASSGETFDVSYPGMQLIIGRAVRFQPFYSTRPGKDRAGSLVEGDARSFHPLPPLKTVAEAPGISAERIPVRLTTAINELGLLQVSCVSADPSVQRSWPLEFDLRPHESASEAPAPGGQASADVGLDAKTLERASNRIGAFFRGEVSRHEKLTANTLLKHLEKIIGIPRGSWSGGLIRAMWTSLFECIGTRGNSVEHEEAWFIMAGFLLRPGYGAAGDAARIDQVWKIQAEGSAHPGKRIRVQEHILWRRVSGGLDRTRQESLLLPDLERLRASKAPPAELVRLAGSLERVNPGTRAELATKFTQAAASLARMGQHPAPWLAALGLLLNRAPLYAGRAAVLEPSLVEAGYEALREFDWSEPSLSEIPPLFLRAARVIDEPALDVSISVRAKIAAQLEKAGVAPMKIERVRSYVPIEASERAGLFGESLPSGLVLG